MKVKLSFFFTGAMGGLVAGLVAVLVTIVPLVVKGARMRAFERQVAKTESAGIASRLRLEVLEHAIAGTGVKPKTLHKAVEGYRREHTDYLTFVEKLFLLRREGDTTETIVFSSRENTEKGEQPQDLSNLVGVGVMAKSLYDVHHALIPLCLERPQRAGWYFKSAEAFQKKARSVSCEYQ